MTTAGVMLDLDGVLLAAGAPIPGAADAVRALQARGHPCAVLTNMTSARPADIAARLAAVGIEIAAERIVTAAVATAEVLRRSYPDARVMLVAERGSVGEFAGCRLVAGPPADLVVVSGPDESWTFSLLDQALRALQGGARLIAMQGNAWWLAADGARLDSGSYVHALAYASGVRPRVIGKPSPAIFRSACRSIGLPPSACVMIGDDLRSDVLAAQRAGLQGVLVRTGKGASFADDPRSAQSAAILDSVAEVPAWLASRTS
ncbi:MAG TPA: HAD-IIA family hydrolase [Gaiellales bacterium]|jgi:HAD superfamily hydrolase (TIGR01458 family)|nr:HAD-IIA family hydrolase [Gaiellales bacterium]